MNVTKTYKVQDSPKDGGSGGVAVVSATATANDVDTEPTRQLSDVYSGLSDSPPAYTGVQKRTFFGPTGQPSTFMSNWRSSTASHGIVNPAYQKDDADDDDDDDYDFNERQPTCNSSSDSDLDSDVDDSVSQKGDNGFRKKEPMTNGKVPNGDFKVGFRDIEAKAQPPPSPTNDRKSKKKTLKHWDRFTQSDKDNLSSSNLRFWDNVFIITKIVIAFLLFCVVLGTAAISKICFIIVAANIFPYTNNSDTKNLRHVLKTLNDSLKYGKTPPEPRETNVQWIWAMMLMAGAPYFFTSVKALWKLLFQMSGRKQPDPITILSVLVIETIHSIGLNILIFVVVPTLDPISGLLICMSIGVIPGILKIRYPRAKESGDRGFCEKIVIALISVIGALGQVASLALWVIHFTKSFSNGDIDIGYIVCLVVAPLFTSVYWWENYVHEGKKESYGIPHLARNMKKFRTKLILYSSIWKMILTIIIPTAMYGIGCKDGSKCADTLYYQESKAELDSLIGEYALVAKNIFGENGHCYHHLPMLVAIIGMLSSAMCFKTGKVACKIMTQIVDYSLPLVLSTPATIGLILGMYAGFLTNPVDSLSCGLPFPKWADNASASIYFINFSDFNPEGLEYFYMMIAGIVGFISLLLITNHVWVPGKERLQRTDKLFVQPLYCGILLDQSLLLNRRRIEKVKRAEDVKTKLSQFKLDDLKDDMDPSDKEAFRTIDTPMIYMCATMWHETENEMLQLLKSIFRMDEDQCTRRHAQYIINRRDPDYYEFEAHIFFDDAFEAHEHDEYEFTVNDYVRLLIKSVRLSASSIHGVSYKIPPPVKTPTPYGGRLEWKLPGQNKLIAHLKDKTFIRHRKRWSQVMYMYYFLGFELFKKETKKRLLQKRAENTFLLALDGDVDFQPRAVQLLIDRMRKNADVGAACGRIHPIGNGAMVWYQKFEYAVSHWLQKAAEDKFGCVLCSPGCFSLFRGLALMDDNVMNRYTTLPTEARHYVQYDQGEDRWLCTLLLQQGHRVEYCAASDALTYAPEGFNEFFNQRRRWTPSTMANIMDLLTDWKNVTKKNPEITLAYILYQALLMVSSILTPGTIFLMILGALNLAYPAIDLWMALLINTIPVAVFVFFCFKTKGDTQLAYAAILSTMYSLVMMIVIVGLLRQAAEFGYCSVTTAFLCFVAGVFVLAAFIHPQEFWCIIHGFLYFLAIPSMSMILMLYALGNLNNVSWGTRETKAPVTAEAEKKKSRFSGICSFLNGCCPQFPMLNRDDEKLGAILDRLDHIETNVRELSTVGSAGTSLIVSGSSARHRVPSPVLMGELKEPLPYTDISQIEMGTGNRFNPAYIEEKPMPRDRLTNPFWMTEDPEMKLLKERPIDSEETRFWWELIDEYLKPLEEDKKKKAEIKADLDELRNKVCLIFILINSLFIIIVFSLQQVVADGDSISMPLPCATPDDKGKYEAGQSVEPISVAFTLVFGVLLFVQFCCMLLHRIATLLHICASTEIFKKKRQVKLPGMDEKGDEESGVTTAGNVMSYEQVYEMVRDMQKDQDADSVSLTSESSYAQSEVDDDYDRENRKKELRAKWKDIAKKRRHVQHNTLGANFRKNFQKLQSVLSETEMGTDDRDETEEIQDLRKKTKFNRMNMKSMKLLTSMTRDPEMKKNLQSKKIKSKWRKVASGALLGEAMKKNQDVGNGGASGGGGTSSLLRRVVQAARAQDKMNKDSKVDEEELVAEVHRDGDGEDDYENEEGDQETSLGGDGATASGSGKGSTGSFKAFEGLGVDQKDLADDSDDSESPYDDVANRLTVPPVENDQWPEEDTYAETSKTIDVLF